MAANLLVDENHVKADEPVDYEIDTRGAILFCVERP
jgi:hypothetical protein